MTALDVLLWGDVAGPRGGCDAWPAECREVAEDAPEPALPWRRMAVEAYAAYRAAHEAEQDAWAAAHPPPEPVPETVSVGQLMEGLIHYGWITEEEGLAALKTGAMPAAMSKGLAEATSAGLLDVEAAKRAERRWAGMYEADRANPMWDLFVAVGMATPAEVDAVFVHAAAVT